METNFKEVTKSLSVTGPVCTSGVTLKIRAVRTLVILSPGISDGNNKDSMHIVSMICMYRSSDSVNYISLSDLKIKCINGTRG